MTRGRTVVGPRYVVRTLVVCLFLALACSCAAGLDSDRTIAQFAHTAWGPKDGAPSAVIALAQSADGYLWLGSPEGLYRFDGVAFERYQPQSGGPFPAHFVGSLLALPNGDLWIGFRGAISLLRSGNATNYTVHEGVPNGRVWSFAQDRAGTIWVATESGLARLEGNRWKEVVEDWNFPGKTAHAIFLDLWGTLWVATEDTLVFLPMGARKFQPTGIRVGQVAQIAQAASGKLWMAETTRSVRPIPVADKRLPHDDTEIQVGAQGILFDRDGALWITSVGDGLRRAPAPELLKGKIAQFSTAVESFTARDGLSDDVALVILQDREGNIWVGTANGLDRFRKTNLIPIILPFKPRYAVLAAGDAGDAWVENQGAMAWVNRGRADPSHPIPPEATSAYRDPAGAIWWIGTDAIHRYDAGKYTTVALPPPFSKHPQGSIMATADGSGTLWLSAQREGLFYRKKGEWQQLEAASEFAKLLPRAAFTDWMGRAWFGYEGGTIILLKDENIRRVFPADDSPVGGLGAINGRGRHTWIGGERGLAFFDGNRFRRIIPADAEAFGPTMGIEETPDGSLWLAENRGVIQVPASEVQQALQSPSYRVKYRLFDSFDGLPGTFSDNRINPRVIQGTDGGLWFATTGGIVWVDPANISTNSVPPPVLIRSVKANGRLSGSLANLVLPPRTTNLQIGYTALSLSVPEKVRFQYLLEGADKEWQDAGTRREAIYTRLGPGDYHFRVIACNNDGVWNETGVHLDFSIAPAWYQTNWFLLLCVAATGFLIWAAHRWHIQRVAARLDEQFQERLRERTRIAQDLHDTLLQGFISASMQLSVANRQLPSDLPAKPIVSDVLELMKKVIEEGRNAVRGMRLSSQDPEDLEQAFSRIRRELAVSPTTSFRIITEGRVRPLHPLVRDELYRIGREALTNAFRHSQATSIEAELEYSDRELRVVVRDNGCGIDPQVLSSGREGHWGLAGMRERAERIGARLKMWSRDTGGTEIELSVPSFIAFQNHSSDRWLLWLTRFRSRRGRDHVRREGNER